MESVNFHTARALLDWQIELGVDECIGDLPVNRYNLPEKLDNPLKAKAAVPAIVAGRATAAERDAVAEADAAAEGAGSLEELRAAMQAFDLCDLKRGARHLVFGDGVPGARVMIVSEPPDRDEDRVGRPFAGQAGQLLDRMFNAIGLGRDLGQVTEPENGQGRKETGIYITHILPWRPPQDRDPRPEEIAMMQPFLKRHIELAAPELLVLMGNWPCQSLLGKRGITRLRGEWAQAVGRPAIPMCHPVQLLRSPAAKREAWADLLSLKERLGISRG